MNGPEMLHYFRTIWPTDKGAWFPGEKVLYREKSLFEDFTESSWMNLLLYGIGGRELTESQSKVVEKIWSLSSSFPDPRLWNNRIAALAGTTRSTGSLALAAATAVTEAKVYGARPVFLAAEFLHRIRACADDKSALEQYVFDRLKRQRYLPGFGRPITSEDERIQPLLEAVGALGYGDGEFLTLVYRVIDVLQDSRYRLKPNIAIFCAALFLDLGFDSRQSYLIAVLAFSAGMFPCYIDAVEKREGMLFPLECNSVQYSGHRKRKYEN